MPLPENHDLIGVLPKVYDNLPSLTHSGTKFFSFFAKATNSKSRLHDDFYVLLLPLFFYVPFVFVVLFIASKRHSHANEMQFIPFLMFFTFFSFALDPNMLSFVILQRIFVVVVALHDDKSLLFLFLASGNTLELPPPPSSLSLWSPVVRRNNFLAFYFFLISCRRCFHVVIFHCNFVSFSVEDRDFSCGEF